ncbi:GNAT family N-acetyltransferase [Planococcus shenhongbingii]|uniref:GNAT family N-acetyltransferase n=1 Tax=Planococcus shenhongbingii TaxID=3058398 RepID=UPI002625895B|nr:GNAT family N-acetyltransferase [Planococcus sp. N016]WKA57967.1 GNAT family N-acetyltransferase [Planococcus sp. N016]
MNISLSIESFPLNTETIKDMKSFLSLFQEDYSMVMQEPVWGRADARGFAVVAYTDEGKLIGFATSVDIVGLHHYEWSAIVHPDYRRQTIGSALADGIHHGHVQREAEEELAAFIEEPGAAEFLKNLGYEADFKEIQLGVTALEKLDLPDGLTVAPFGGEREELESLLRAAFDEEVIPVIAHNLEQAGRDVWVMKKEGRLVATATMIAEEDALWVTAFAVHPEQQGKGYGQAFLSWSRNLAFIKGKQQVLLDVETDNHALRVYEKAGFVPVSTVAYWKKISVSE